MLLAIDVGNTNTVFAAHDGNDWVAQWRSATSSMKTADEHAIWLRQLCEMQEIDFTEFSDVIISTVVPQAMFNFRNFARRYLYKDAMFIGSKTVDLGVKVRIARPEQVGADRLVNAVGAHARYDGALIIIDSGTATTFDVIGDDGSFEGGIIAPGINLSMRALHEAAASLPRIAIEQPNRVIGQDTVSAMQSGIFLGYIELIDGLTRRIKTEYGKPMRVIGTGGIASLFSDVSSEIDTFDPDITINGLLEIYRRNKDA